MTGFARAAIIAATLAVSCAAALAQPVRGTIEKADGHLLAIRSSDGAKLTLSLVDNALIVAVVHASMADIKEGTYLGSAAMPQADGSQKALEIHIFPESMRGRGDGHRPYAPVPNGTMTNGATSGPVVTSVDGSTLVVKYKDGEKKIVVPPNVPIVRYEIGSQGDLKPGARITLLAPVRKPDGTLEADRINVGRDGVVPQ
jgi:hypothetical protein